MEARKIGNIEQQAFARHIEFTNGKANGGKAILCKNERLNLTLLESSALDIFDLSFAGNNMSFISKNGLVSRALANTNAFGFANSFGGGFLYTCGLDNIGNRVDDKIIHGNISSMPALITINKTMIENGNIVLEIEGKINDTLLFGKDFEVIRNYKIYKDKIILSDTISNKVFSNQDVILLYHFNIGYPLLDSCSIFKANIGNTECRNDDCRIENFEKMSDPLDICDEEVFIHTIDEKRANIEIENSKLKQKIKFSYDTTFLKYLTQWKSMQSRDYALGIEPSTSHLDNKTYISLAPNQSIQNTISIEFIELI